MARSCPSPTGACGASRPWRLRRLAGARALCACNHEYDAIDLDAGHAALRQTCERLGIRWLERECAVIDGIRFVGTTLWSDYDALVDHANARGTDPLTHRLRQREKAYRAANFYLRKMDGRRLGRLFDAEAMRDLGLACQDWLRGALQQPFDGITDCP